MKSVNKVMKVFNRAIQDLGHVAEVNEEYSIKKFDEANTLLQEGQELATEAVRARRIAGRLANLLDQE